MNFRPDIHALRALAVLAVLLFHFNVPGFSGGFVGVDVFFVISGYLMLSIIASGLEKKTFSLANFYWARARRIIPALAVMCASVLAFGWFWLAPTEYKLLGDHAVSSIGFFSNFVYKGEEGYFDLPSQYKWLLHTWSLSAEWQFYLIYPLILMAMARLGRGSMRVLRGTVIVLAVVSLAVSIVMSPIKTGFSFFLLPTRIWEMAVGGLVYFYASNRSPTPLWSGILSLLGVAMIAVSAMMFDGNMVWPGYLALVPVIGAMLFMAAANQQNILIRNAAVQKMGTWSYSIYLWHWPLLVAAEYFELKLLPYWQAAGIVISIVAGAVSYALVERPTRKLPLNQKNLAVMCAVVGVLALAGFGVWYKDGLTARVSEEIVLVDSEAQNTPPIYKKHGCTLYPNEDGYYVCAYGDPKNVGAILWGDSHGGAVITALSDALDKSVVYYLNQCPVIFNARLRSKGKKAPCALQERSFMRYVRTAPKNVPVIIADRLSAQVHGVNEGMQKDWGIRYLDLTAEEKKLSPHTIFKKKLVESLCRVAKYRPVYVMKPTPEMGRDVPKTMARLMMIGRDAEISLPLTEYNERHAIVVDAIQAAGKQCGVKMLDPAPYLCADGKKCIGSYMGRPIYVDDDHISEYGNRLLLPMFRKIKR